MSYLYLAASAACSLLLVHLLKVGESSNQRMINTLTVNYLIAALFAFGIAGFPDFGKELEVSAAHFLLFAGFTGAVFIGNFLIYSKSIHLNG
ncbi:MAG: hypothetical protein R3281_03295, partial [Balneolaceae bacterium]|nr:hypothetical protein [Balneolaceae bacterium]